MEPVLGGPRGYALHQQPVGTPDVEERPVAIHRRNNGTPGPLPTRLVPTIPRAPTGIFGLQVSAFEQSPSLFVIVAIVAVQRPRPPSPT